MKISKSLFLIFALCAASFASAATPVAGQSMKMVAVVPQPVITLDQLIVSGPFYFPAADPTLTSGWNLFLGSLTGTGLVSTVFPTKLTANFVTVGTTFSVDNGFIIDTKGTPDPDAQTQTKGLNPGFLKGQITVGPLTGTTPTLTSGSVDVATINTTKLTAGSLSAPVVSTGLTTAVYNGASGLVIKLKQFPAPTKTMTWCPMLDASKKTFYALVVGTCQ